MEPTTVLIVFGAVSGLVAVVAIAIAAFEMLPTRRAAKDAAEALTRETLSRRDPDEKPLCAQAGPVEPVNYFGPTQFFGFKPLIEPESDRDV